MTRGPTTGMGRRKYRRRIQEMMRAMSAGRWSEILM